MEKENTGITLVLNGNVFIDGKFEKKDICIEGGRVAEIAEQGRLSFDKENLSCAGIIDAADNYVIPGPVDAHTHGRVGLDFSKITEEGLEKLLASYGNCGVTSVMATTMTNEPAVVEKSLQVLGAYIKKQKTSDATGAKLLGIHLEGPFLGKEKKGAHKESWLRNPDWMWFDKMQNISGGNVRMITIDPTLAGAEEFMKKCVQSGVKVSLGHTDCNYETAIKAEKLGADRVTHTFNAMNPLHHREPGLIGAAMDTGMYTELICDGVHVHPAVVRMLFSAHPDRVVLVSDSIPAAGQKDGEHESGGLKVRLQNKVATLPDGTIAGSAVSLLDCIRNAVKYGVPPETAINSATYLAAKSVGMEGAAGRIAPGLCADLLTLNREWQLKQVILNGKTLNK